MNTFQSYIHAGIQAFWLGNNSDHFEWSSFFNGVHFGGTAALPTLYAAASLFGTTCYYASNPGAVSLQAGAYSEEEGSVAFEQKCSELPAWNSLYVGLLVKLDIQGSTQPPVSPLPPPASAATQQLYLTFGVPPGSYAVYGGVNTIIDKLLALSGITDNEANTNMSREAIVVTFTSMSDIRIDVKWMRDEPGIARSVIFAASAQLVVSPEYVSLTQVDGGSYSASCTTDATLCQQQQTAAAARATAATMELAAARSSSISRQNGTSIRGSVRALLMKHKVAQQRPQQTEVNTAQGGGDGGSSLSRRRGRAATQTLPCFDVYPPSIGPSSTDSTVAISISIPVTSSTDDAGLNQKADDLQDLLTGGNLEAALQAAAASGEYSGSVMLPCSTLQLGTPQPMQTKIQVVLIARYPSAAADALATVSFADLMAGLAAEGFNLQLLEARRVFDDGKPDGKINFVLPTALAVSLVALVAVVGVVAAVVVRARQFRRLTSDDVPEARQAASTADVHQRPLRAADAGSSKTHPAAALSAQQRDTTYYNPTFTSPPTAGMEHA